MSKQSESAMGDLTPSDDDLTFEKILNALLDGDKNLDLKTHINKPKQLASLKIIENVLMSAGCNKASGLVDAFTKKYLRYMVSFQRMSRTETIRAISEPRDEMKPTKKERYAKKIE
jgi:hypothetical protein